MDLWKENRCLLLAQWFEIHKHHFQPGCWNREHNLKSVIFLGQENHSWLTVFLPRQYGRAPAPTMPYWSHFQLSFYNMNVHLISKCSEGKLLILYGTASPLGGITVCMVLLITASQYPWQVYSLGWKICVEMQTLDLDHGLPGQYLDSSINRKNSSS